MIEESVQDIYITQLHHLHLVRDLIQTTVQDVMLKHVMSYSFLHLLCSVLEFYILLLHTSTVLST